MTRQTTRVSHRMERFAISTLVFLTRLPIAMYPVVAVFIGYIYFDSYSLGSTFAASFVAGELLGSLVLGRIALYRQYADQITGVLVLSAVISLLLCWRLPWIAVLLLFSAAGLVPAGLPGWSQDRLTTACGKNGEATASVVARIINSAVRLLAPLVAGFALIAHTASAALAGAAFCYMLSAWLSRTMLASDTRVDPLTRPSRGRDRLSIGFAKLYLLVVAVIIPVGALQQTVAVTLHALSATESQAGSVLVISGAGSVVGSLSAARTSRIGRCYSGAVIACIVVALIPLPILYERWHVMWVYGFAVALGAVSAFAIVAITTHAAEVTHGAECGAVFSILYACASIGYLISTCISVVAGSTILVWILTILVAASLWVISKFFPTVPIIGSCADIDEETTNPPAAVRVVAEKIQTICKREIKMT